MNQEVKQLGDTGQMDILIAGSEKKYTVTNCFVVCLRLLLHIDFNSFCFENIMNWLIIGLYNGLSFMFASFYSRLPSNLWYKAHLSRQLNCQSLRCSWSSACQRRSNYFFILDLTSGFKGFCKDSRKTIWEVLGLGAFYIRDLTVFPFVVEDLWDYICTPVFIWWFC